MLHENSPHSPLAKSPKVIKLSSFDEKAKPLDSASNSPYVEDYDEDERITVEENGIKKTTQERPSFLQKRTALIKPKDVMSSDKKPPEGAEEGLVTSKRRQKALDISNRLRRIRQQQQQSSASFPADIE